MSATDTPAPVQGYFHGPLTVEASCCGYHREGANWGYLNGPTWHDYCQHVREMRYCSSCSERWWMGGQGEGEWDIDGEEHADCPECVEALRCVPCGQRTDNRDRLPFGDGFAHAACAMKATLFRSTDFGEARVFADAVALLTPTDGGGR